MKVSHVTTRLIRTPADNPLVVGIDHGNATRDFVTLELGTDQGLMGIGLTFFGGALSGALREARCRWQPSAASDCATPKPMPREPPVINAVRPESLRSMRERLSFVMG